MALVWLGDKAIASDISDGDAVHFWRGALPFGGLMQGASSVSEGSENKVEEWAHDDSYDSSSCRGKRTRQ